jgi:hypothetical protein
MPTTAPIMTGTEPDDEDDDEDGELTEYKKCV